MFAVVFRVHPADSQKKEEYLGFAKHLKPILESIDGFIDNERFESKRHSGWVLSLSTWRDEKAVVRWRTQGEHHRIQGEGRNHVFSDYQLSVCEVTSDTQPPQGLEVVAQRLDESAVASGKALAITELTPATEGTLAVHSESIPGHVGLSPHATGLADFDVFESIYNPGKMLLLTWWRTAGDAAAWTPTSYAGVAQLRHRRLRNIRDYGMFERREAPQYYPDVKRESGSGQP
jgi:heme-degrading monooxygenase HmoA